MSNEKSIPVPLVLAAASLMVCVGIVAIVAGKDQTPEPEPVESNANPVLIETNTPEQIAETFLDAWRKRDHETAKRFSSGEALAVVRARESEDGRMTADERRLKAQLWDHMSASRLAFEPAESENVADGMWLRGRAEGTFIGQPYIREVAFRMLEGTDGFTVDEVEFGDILSDVPSNLRIQNEYDDGRLTPRPPAERPAPEATTPEAPADPASVEP